MRLIYNGEKHQVVETDTPDEYLILRMIDQKLPNSGEVISVQDLENPLCTIRFEGDEGVQVEELQAIINDRIGR